jgi:hypothetical protein
MMGVTDGNGDRSDPSAIEQDLSVIKEGYQQHVKDNLQIVPTGTANELRANLKIWCGE